MLLRRGGTARDPRTGSREASFNAPRHGARCPPDAAATARRAFAPATAGSHSANAMPPELARGVVEPGVCHLIRGSFSFFNSYSSAECCTPTCDGSRRKQFGWEGTYLEPTGGNRVSTDYFTVNVINTVLPQTADPFACPQTDARLSVDRTASVCGQANRCASAGVGLSLSWGAGSGCACS